ncbi:MAG: 23S rRNA (adenine(2503)-C(2))-methyltransferase RlmN [Planctomycetota bacterium]|nr:23S rRNA (adenine(2503)-C(2))-methyltransferase RlmN [Planctomycetota bacterium]
MIDPAPRTIATAVHLPQQATSARGRRLDPRALDSGSFVEAMRDHGTSRPAGLAAYRAWYRDHDPRPLEAIGVSTEPRGEIVRTEIEGLTVKFALRLDDGLESESVVIPMRKRSGGFSRTLCVSSQVGCAMGCRFCETAQMGLLRSLATEEIVEQWRFARFILPRTPEEIAAAGPATGHEIRNIVFMGMGEPMENLDAVLPAVRVLCDRNGPGLAASRIAISTVGRVEGIRRLGAFIQEPGYRGLGLAISVNAPNDAVRDEIMPINRAEPIDALFEAIRAFPKRPSAALCIEYVLIPGVNDRLEHCDELCGRLRGLKCSLNVIPYNPRRDSPWPAPEESTVEAFIGRAIANGQFVKRRGTKGRDVMGACGQLGNPEIRRAGRRGTGV